MSIANSNPRLILGLGNPGKKYEKTRHNIGFRVIDAIIAKLRITNYLPTGQAGELRKKFESEIVIIKNTIILAKPQTFMNNSGEAVLKISRFYKIQLERIWIVYDDIDLQLGTLRIRKKGSSGGHNGVQSIIDKLGSREFQRFRLGVGPVPSEIDPADFVLSNFLKEEQKTADEMISSAALAITSALVEDTDDAEG